MDSRVCTGMPVMVTGAVHGLGYYIGPYVKIKNNEMSKLTSVVLSPGLVFNGRFYGVYLEKEDRSPFKLKGKGFYNISNKHMRIATYEEARKLPPIRSLLSEEDLANPANRVLWEPPFLRKGESVLDAVKRLEEFGKGAEFAGKIRGHYSIERGHVTIHALAQQRMNAGQPIKFAHPPVTDLGAFFEHPPVKGENVVYLGGVSSRMFRRAELLNAIRVED